VINRLFKEKDCYGAVATRYFEFIAFRIFFRGQRSSVPESEFSPLGNRKALKDLLSRQQSPWALAHCIIALKTRGCEYLHGL